MDEFNCQDVGVRGKDLGALILPWVMETVPMQKGRLQICVFHHPRE